MKRKLLVLLSGCLLLATMTGCSGLEQKLGNEFLKKADIQTDSDYQEYVQISNQLDENGYAVTDNTSDEAKDGTIMVSLATNNHLDIQFYKDEAKSECIVGTQCYLNPGDAIYASEAVSTNPASDLYHFQEYRIYQCSDTGERELLSTQENNGGLVYQIPSDFTGTALSIVPVGQYEDRQFDFHVYYLNNAGEKTDLTGTAGEWSVNGVKGQTSINAVESYIIRYAMDTTRYFYVSATPEPFTKDPNDVGYVEFYEEDPMNGAVSYAVEVHPFLTAEIVLDQEGTVSVNGEEPKKLKKGESLNVSSLRYGEVIEIETGGDFTLSSNEYNHFAKEMEYMETGGKKYTVRVVKDATEGDSENVKKIYSVILDSKDTYGTATYKLDGKVLVHGWNLVGEGQKLTVTYKITDKNYKFEEESSGIVKKVQGFLSRNEKTVEIPMNSSMENQKIYAEDYFKIMEKEK